MTEQRQYICTRPKLATQLIESGYDYSQTANPFREGTTAWVFPINLSLAKDVAEYYSQIGRPTPHSISQTLKEVEV